MNRIPPADSALRCPKSNRAKILVVDDEPLNRAMFRDLLNDCYTLRTASSGEEALTILPAFVPDLILLDIMLPGMDGYETCRAIRSEPSYSFTKIVMVSIKRNLQERLQGYEAGADDFLAKPFDCDELSHKVRIFLHLKRVEEVDLIAGYLLNRFSIEARTPLNGMIEPAKTLLQDDLPPHEVRQIAGIVLESAKRLHSFVRKTTLFCNLKKGLMPVKQKASLVSHLHMVIDKAGDAAATRSITIELNSADDIELPADWIMIDTALGYILENAIQQSPTRSTIAIRMSATSGCAQVTVTDQGNGIKPGLVDKLFDGNRCMQNLARLDDCKGFSLALAKQILDLHDGAISAFNNPEKGATFRLTLPLAPAPPSTMHESNFAEWA
jgi:two-component system sensor histidine kinase/response regulator